MLPSQITIFLLPWSLFLQLSSSVPFHLCHCSIDTIFLSTFSNSDVSVPSNLFINSYQLFYHLKLQFFNGNTRIVGTSCLASSCEMRSRGNKQPGQNKNSRDL